MHFPLAKITSNSRGRSSSVPRSMPRNSPAGGFRSLSRTWPSSTLRAARRMNRAQASERRAAAVATRRRGIASSADRSLQGLLTEALGSSVVATAGSPPRWLAFGIGSYLASQVEPRSPYYRQLRQTAFANYQQGWPTRAIEALGGSDQITPEGLRSIAFAIVEAMMSSEMRQRFPNFVAGMLEGGNKLDDTVAAGLWRHPRRIHQRHRRVDRTEIRATPMSGRGPGSHEAGSHRSGSLFPSRRIRLEARDLSGRRNSDDRREEPHALGRPLRAPLRRA